MNPKDIINSKSGCGYLRGRVAMSAILRTLGIKKDDSIIVPAYSCSALAEAIFAVGATPVYVDIDPLTYNINPTEVTKRLSREKIQALVIQHTYGIPANMDALMEIACQYNIPVIEDCCHTLLSRWRNQAVGTFGYGAYYSFEAGKPITTGIGGWARVNDRDAYAAIKADYQSCTTPSFSQQIIIEMMRQAADLFYRPSTYWRVKSLWNTLQKTGLVKQTYNEFELNSDTTALSANSQLEFTSQLGSIQQRALRKGLTNYKQRLVKHIANTEFALATLNEANVCELPQVPDHADAVILRMPVRVKDKERTLALAAEMRVELSDNYTSPAHPYKGEALKALGYEIGSCPNAEDACNHVVCIPLNEKSSSHDIMNAVDLICEVD